MKKKGFTLIELIIVIAIIGVLSAIIIPSWGYFLSRSRVRTSNAKAKTIFNAAQTAAIEYSSYERVRTDDIYLGNGDFIFYWDGENAQSLSGSTTNTGADLNFARKINKIIDPTTVYQIYISNYQVQSVVASRYEDDRYVGAYPVTVENSGVTVNRVSDCNMEDFDLT